MCSPPSPLPQPWGSLPAPPPCSLQPRAGDAPPPGAPLRPSGPVAAPPAPLRPRLRSSLTASFWNPVVSSFPQQTPVPPPPDSPHQTLASDLSWGTEGQPGAVTAGQAGRTISSFTGAWTPGPEGGEAGVWTPGSEGGGAGGLDPGSGVWTLALRRVWVRPWLLALGRRQSPWVGMVWLQPVLGHNARCRSPPSESRGEAGGGAPTP